MVRRCFCSRSVSVLTSMPSKTVVTQAGNSLLLPLISTTHRRHAPTSLRPSRWQRVGMSMSFSRATSRMVWPARALTSWPSITRVLTSAPVAHANTSTGAACGVATSAAGASMLQTPAGQRLCTMWSMYSFLKYFSVLRTGLGAVCPRPQRLVSLTVAQRSTSRSRSAMVP